MPSPPPTSAVATANHTFSGSGSPFSDSSQCGYALAAALMGLVEWVLIKLPRLMRVSPRSLPKVSTNSGEAHAALSDSCDHQRTLRLTPSDYRNVRKAVFADQINIERKRCLLVGLAVAAFDQAFVIALQDEDIGEPREVRNGLSHRLGARIVKSAERRN